MPLTPGTTLGSYEVTALIGEGGMGEVYRARDTKLDRDVALKVLPQAFTEDPDRLARFEREAKVLASLNHPGIAGIYGLEESGDTRALVLELVEGPTLADRIAKGPIPLDEALPIAKQIAEALEAAHEAGVIHRDLKPANIKVRGDGTVKVLDFGLAKALDLTLEGDPSQSPTLTAMASQAGTILGTAAYMSPEQARGEGVDRRADLWAFGVVLYEMLAGRRPFEGRTISDTLASVLARDPDLDALPTDTPRAVRRLLRRCLEKEPKRRLRDIADGVVQLEDDLSTGLEPPVSAARVAVGPTTVRRPLGVALAGLGLVMGTAVGVWLFTRPAQVEPRVERFAIPPPAPQTVGISQGRRDIAISPDGTRVVYSATGGAPLQFYVRSVDELIARPLEGPDDLVFGPFFSPNGAWLGFFDASDTTLKKVPILGGPPVMIGNVSGLMLGASWADDDTIFFGNRPLSGLWRISANGGDPEEVTTPEVGVNHAWPDVLPGSRAILFTILTGSVEQSQIAVYDLDTGETKVLVSGGSAPRYSQTGHIVYGVNGTLRAVAFDVDRLEVSDPNPVPVLDGVVTKPEGAANFDLASDGSLAYIAGPVTGGGLDRRLIWVDREGSEEAIDLPGRAYSWPRISPDGAKVAATIFDQSQRPSDLPVRSGGLVGFVTSDIWIGDLRRGTLAKLTTDPAGDDFALWTPDGERVVFMSNRDGAVGLYWTAADGSGPVEQLLTIEDTQFIAPYGWSPDGRTLVFEYRQGFGAGDIGVLSMDGEREWEPLIQSEAAERAPTISPDGRWVAYTSDETGEPTIYASRFPELGSRVTVSRGIAFQSVWSASGRELFYLGGPWRARSVMRGRPGAGGLEDFGGGVLAVAVEPGETLRLGETTVVNQARNQGRRGERDWDVSPDGERILLIKGEGEPDEVPESEAVLVQHWSEVLTQLIPVD